MLVALIILQVFSGGPASGALAAAVPAAPWTPANTETVTYTNNVALNSGTITTPQAQAVDAFVTAEKGNGNWTHLTELAPMAGDSNSARVKLVYATTATITPSSGGTYSAAHGFVGAGNYYIEHRVFGDQLEQRQLSRRPCLDFGLLHKQPRDCLWK